MPTRKGAKNGATIVQVQVWQDQQVLNKIGLTCSLCSHHVREDHNHQIFGVQFNPFLDRSQAVFATVGKDRVSIYECVKTSLESESGEEAEEEDGIRLLQVYADPDVSESYTCTTNLVIIKSLLLYRRMRVSTHVHGHMIRSLETQCWRQLATAALFAFST